MRPFQPAYAATDRQPANSRHDPNQKLRQNDREQQHPAYQVDSWRSYRDDATNLQQTVGYATDWNYDHIAQSQQVPYQQAWGYMNPYGLNPAASPFQPNDHNTRVHSVPLHFSPYQPLRVSNGRQESDFVQQSRFSSTSANNRGGQQYALRSQGPVNPRAALQDVPVLSIEPHKSPYSSIPINLVPRTGVQAFKRVTPHASSRSVSPPLVPSPTREYLAQAALPPAILEAPRSLLVVVDLNGTLLRRGVSRGTSFVLRPGVNNFMDYLFANHVVMIYSSARPENVQGMVSKLLHPTQRSQLAALWSRDKLDLTKVQYHAKVQTYKKLEKIWADSDIQQRAGEGRRWDQSNTVLVDDSHLKALAQPYNLMRVDEFINNRPGGHNYNGAIKDTEHLEALNKWNTAQQKIIEDLQDKLEKLKWTKDVSRLIRSWQLADDQKHDPVNDQSFESEQIQLLTPKSLESRFSQSDQSDDGDDFRQAGIGELAGRTESQHVAHPRVGKDSDNGSDGSVSPINEETWKDILEGVEQDRDLPQSTRRDS